MERTPPARLATDILDHQTTAVMVVASTCVVRYLNPAAEHLFGFSGHKGAGAALAELFFDADTAFGDLDNALATGQSYTLRQQDLDLRDGTRLTVDLTVALMQPGSNLLIELQPLNRLLRINRDNRLIATERTTASLVRGLAHEVKNPLGGIRGAAQLLQRELASADQREYTSVIIREADRLTALVDQLLGPTRELSIRRVNVHHILEHVLSVVRSEHGADSSGRGISFVRDYDPSLPDIEVDEDQMIQAFMNIVGNACHALRGAGEPSVTLRTRIQRQFTIAGHRHRLLCRIDVIDNGHGVPAEIADRIFFPMISGRPEGSGLGLAITQTIIRRHSGVIEFTSDPGHTTFSVLLPLDHHAPPDSSAPHQVRSHE
jgi:two-component system nitrogen regulation sensor histidine kinase GlnL